jgi:hypothetical protein
MVPTSSWVQVKSRRRRAPADLASQRVWTSRAWRELEWSAVRQA